MRSPLASLLLWCLHIYRRFISPMTQPRCKFYPTCSTYSREAIIVHGAFKGLVLSAYRLLRCHPWSLGGVDYVPEKGSWHRPPYYSMTADELHSYWKQLDAATTDAQIDHIIRHQQAYNHTCATQASAKQSATRVEIVTSNNETCIAQKTARAPIVERPLFARGYDDAPKYINHCERHLRSSK